MFGVRAFGQQSWQALERSDIEDLGWSRAQTSEDSDGEDFVEVASPSHARADGAVNGLVAPLLEGLQGAMRGALTSAATLARQAIATVAQHAPSGEEATAVIVAAQAHLRAGGRAFTAGQLAVVERWLHEARRDVRDPQLRSPTAVQATLLALTRFSRMPYRRVRPGATLPVCRLTGAEFELMVRGSGSAGQVFRDWAARRLACGFRVGPGQRVASGMFVLEGFDAVLGPQGCLGRDEAARDAFFLLLKGFAEPALESVLSAELAPDKHFPLKTAGVSVAITGRDFTVANFALRCGMVRERQGYVVRSASTSLGGSG